MRSTLRVGLFALTLVLSLASYTPPVFASPTRVWEVGRGENQYTSIQAALDAIAADPVPPSQNSPAQILVYPGRYTMTSTLGIPPWTSVKGTDRFAVQLYNATTDMFRCDGNNVSIAQLTILASATNLWAILGNNKVNVWIQDIYFSTNNGSGTQGLLYCTGSTYFGVRIDRLWASTRRTSGFMILLENTSADTRDIDVQFTNFSAIAGYIGAGGGGILRVVKSQNIRLRDLDLRTTLTGQDVRFENGGAPNPPYLYIMNSLGQGGVPIYTDPNTTITVDNSSFVGSSINGTSTIRNSSL